PLLLSDRRRRRGRVGDRVLAAADRAEDRAAIEIVKAGTAIAVLAGALGPAVFIGRHLEPTLLVVWGIFSGHATCLPACQKQSFGAPQAGVGRGRSRRLYRSRTPCRPALYASAGA